MLTSYTTSTADANAAAPLPVPMCGTFVIVLDSN
jgi:hypothetical protein